MYHYLEYHDFSANYKIIYNVMNILRIKGFYCLYVVKNMVRLRRDGKECLMKRESNVRYRENDKRWEGKVPTGRRKDGRQVYESVYGKTCREAVEKKQEKEKNLGSRP